jgi:hypothetical protein
MLPYRFRLCVESAPHSGSDVWLFKLSVGMTALEFQVETLRRLLTTPFSMASETRSYGQKLDRKIKKKSYVGSKSDV